jgi:protein-tyrosine-phosphatase
MTAPEAGGGTPFRILFVCTGNTCRSPMAEAIARHRATERGWGTVEFRSAGVSAWPGSPATEAVVRVANRHGVEGLEAHRSTPVTGELLEWADLILAMTPSHLHLLLATSGTLGAEAEAAPAGEPMAPEAPGGPEGGEAGGGEEELHVGLLTSFAARGEAWPDPGDPGVPDPFGGSDAEYEATWEALEGLVERVLDRLAAIVRP